MRFQTEEGAGPEETIGGEKDNGKAPLYSRGAPPDPGTPEGSAEAARGLERRRRS